MDSTCEHKQTPLHYAAKSDSTQIAEYLITELKVNKEARDYKQRTPLLIAAEYGKNCLTSVIESKNIFFL